MLIDLVKIQRETLKKRLTSLKNDRFIYETRMCVHDINCCRSSIFGGVTRENKRLVYEYTLRPSNSIFLTAAVNNT